MGACLQAAESLITGDRAAETSPLAGLPSLALAISSPPSHPAIRSMRIEHVVCDRQVDELVAGQPIGRLGPQVECAIGWRQLESGREDAHHEVALAAVGGDVLGAVDARAGERSVLNDRWRADEAVLLHLGHRLDDLGRAAGVAQVPAGHAEGLGVPDQHHGVGVDLGHRGHRLIAEGAVDLVADHGDAMLGADLCDRLELALGDDAAGGVGRRVGQQQFGLGRDQLLEPISIDAEAGLIGVEVDRPAAEKVDQVLVQRGMVL